MRILKTSLLVASLTLVGVASAQTQKPKTKPATKSAPQKSAPQAPAARPVLGTAQLPGDDGKLNQAYTMGERGKFNFVLTGVRYTKTRWNHDDDSVTADRDHKIVVLSFQVQNPNAEITQFNDATFTFTAIDQEGENHEAVGRVIQKNGTKDLNLMMKPAQRVDCEAVVVVPAKGTIPKLMVAHRSGGAVLRYDLHDVVKTLDKPFSANGIDAAPEFKGEPDVFYPHLLSDVRYASTAFQERQAGSHTIGEKDIFLLAKMTFRGGKPGNAFLRFEGEAIDAEGDRYPSERILKAGSEEPMANYAELGQEVNGRMVFMVPKGIKVAKIRVWEVNGGKSSAVEYPIDAYATLDGKPLGGEKAGGEKASGSPSVSVSGIQADEYATVLRKADGTVAMEFAHVERREGAAKATELTVGGKRALLLEEGDATTLYLPDTQETLRAPKAKDKEPVTSLEYFTMAYANATAPKPKKRNPFGQIGRALLEGGAQSLGGAIMSSGSLSNLGSIAAGKVIESATERTLTHQLGRAVMTSTESLSGGGHNASVAVDKKTYAETTFKATKSVDPASLRIDGAAQGVDATTLYKRFAEFLTKGLGSA